MPRYSRLGRSDFSSPRAGGRRLHGTYTSLTAVPLKEGSTKASCVVSKKVSLLAVKRNLVQRRLRSALRKLGLPKGPLALIITAKRESIGATYKEIEADLAKLLARL